MTNNYRECEMLRKGKAHKIKVTTEERRRNVARGEGYILPPVGEIVVLCEVKRGQCPYPGREGQRGENIYPDLPTGDLCVCNTNGLIDKREGLVKKAGLFRINIS